MEFTWYIVTHFLKSITALQQILHGALCYTNTWLLIAVLGRVPCLHTGLRSNLFEDQVPGVFVLKGHAEGSQKYETASDVQRFLTALRGPSAPTSLLPYYQFQFPCPLQTAAGYSKPQPNCHCHAKSNLTTSKQVFPVVCFVCESIIFSQDSSLYMPHIFPCFIYLCFFSIFSSNNLRGIHL